MKGIELRIGSSSELVMITNDDFAITCATMSGMFGLMQSYLHIGINAD